jgi:hypothetical protein
LQVELKGVIGDLTLSSRLYLRRSHLLALKDNL